MWIKKNWIVSKLSRLNPAVRVLIIVFSFLLLAALLAWGMWNFLLSGRTPFFVPRYQLFLYGTVLWGVTAFAVHGIVSLGRKMSPSAKNLVANLWSMITCVAMVATIGALCLISAISNSFIAGDISSRVDQGLVWCSSPSDKYCTVYCYKTSGNRIEGMDLDITLELTDEPGVEYPVCCLEDVTTIGIAWKGTRSFLVNGKYYTVQKVKAAVE